MNESEKQFGELLKNLPRDESFRSEHRDLVRWQAIQAFDDAAAPPAPSNRSLVETIRRPLARRSAVRWVIAAAIAASLSGAMIAWYGFSDSSPTGTDRIAAAHSDLDEKLAAAFRMLSDFDDGQSASFDHGVQACLGERYSLLSSRLAGGKRSPEKWEN